MNSQKELFNLRQGIHYLNCAYKAPLLDSVEKAGIKAIKRGRNPIDIGVDDFFEVQEDVRKEFAKLVNTEPSRIAIIPSTSYGFASILKNTKAKKGGYAVTVQDEFPSAYFSLKKWCDENENTLEIVNPSSPFPFGKSWNENLIDKITTETSVVLISSVHWMNGVRFDLEGIGKKCQEVGATFLVDGTQSVGALPIDVRRCQIDALVCAAYKWLFGPYSTGLMYLGESFDGGIPLEESWMNRTNAKEFSALHSYEPDYRPHAARYNVGETTNFILMPMLLAALRQINTWQAENIQLYCKKLIQPLIAFLDEIGAPLEDEKYIAYHLLGLQLPNGIDNAILKASLEKNQIYTSVRGAFIRISVHVFNDENDIYKLVEVLDEIVRRGN